MKAECREECDCLKDWGFRADYLDWRILKDYDLVGFRERWWKGRMRKRREFETLFWHGKRENGHFMTGV